MYSYSVNQDIGVLRAIQFKTLGYCQFSSEGLVFLLGIEK